ncbi:MAG: LysR family transcriptional regulator [Tagaea sp.]|nr:LysR family transcriptional regulator [Tagaea sp.]
MAARDFRLLAYFVEIVDAGGLRAAARRLSLSPPVLSAALADLEAITKTTLLRRGRRGVEPTPAGRALHAEAAAMASLGPRGAAPKGELRVTLPSELCVAWLPARLRAFERACPGVRVTLEASDVPVDLARSACELALRASFVPPDGSLPPAGLAVLPLELVAAPALLRGLSRDPAARLAAIPMIVLAGARRDAAISARGRTGATLRATPPTRMIVDNGVVAKELAAQGMGAALAIGAAVAGDLRAGRLARVLPGHGFGAVAVRALVRDRYPSAPARAFLDFLARQGTARSASLALAAS